ncbi:MAG: glycerate kinase [Christensenellales bacterium]|jgi:glycerate kinase
MKIVIISNAYKGSRTSVEVANDIERGIKRVADAECVKLSAADGGDGTLETLINAVGGKIYYKKALNPLGKCIQAAFGILDNGKGVVEMALVSGLALLKKYEKNPMKTTSYGTGQMIKELLNKGVKDIIVGIGGSATNDGGAGMAEALGVKFYDSDGNLLKMCGGNLSDISDIDFSGLDERIADTKITVACDVTNPLYGEDGAAYVYAPQKGAGKREVELLDEGLRTLATVVHSVKGVDNSLVSGAGAAGGMGYGLMTFLNARLLPGVDTMLEAVNYEEHLDGADLVITGEGRIDYQSAFGKVPAGVAIRAKARNIPVIAIAGSIGEGAEKLYELGVSAIISIAEGPCSLDYAISNSSELIADTAERIMRIMEAGSGIFNR